VAHLLFLCPLGVRVLLCLFSGLRAVHSWSAMFAHFAS
jgi:hypothetical protein